MAKPAQRWTALRKESLLIAIRKREISRDDAMRQHSISEEEMTAMEESYRRRGLAGLRVDPFVSACRVCGCVDERACVDPQIGACWWVEQDLCSHCQAGEVARVQMRAIGNAVATIGFAAALTVAIIFALRFLHHH